MGQTKNAKFWCECSLGYKTEARLNRHGVLRGHQAVAKQPKLPERRKRWGD